MERLGTCSLGAVAVILFLFIIRMYAAILSLPLISHSMHTPSTTNVPHVCSNHMVDRCWVLTYITPGHHTRSCNTTGLCNSLLSTVQQHITPPKKSLSAVIKGRPYIDSRGCFGRGLNLLNQKKDMAHDLKKSLKNSYPPPPPLTTTISSNSDFPPLLDSLTSVSTSPSHSF